jgi:ketosteroid isomerase-like protein
MTGGAAGREPPDAATAATLAAVRRFSEAFARQDVDAVMAAMTEDCVFENTWPPPDGERHVGRAAVRRCWERFFRENPSATFEPEETFAAGDRCVVRWVYRWRHPDGSTGHVRGIDLFRVRDGKVLEKLSYVKG